jgi:hypothetical protein
MLETISGRVLLNQNEGLKTMRAELQDFRSELRLHEAGRNMVVLGSARDADEASQRLKVDPSFAKHADDKHNLDLQNCVVPVFVKLGKVLSTKVHANGFIEDDMQPWHCPPLVMQNTEAPGVTESVDRDWPFVIDEQLWEDNRTACDAYIDVRNDDDAKVNVKENKHQNAKIENLPPAVIRYRKLCNIHQYGRASHRMIYMVQSWTEACIVLVYLCFCCIRFVTCLCPFITIVSFQTFYDNRVVFLGGSCQTVSDISSFVFKSWIWRGSKE